MTPPQMSQSDRTRFLEQVRQGSEDECWLWTGGCTGDGYGAFWCDGQQSRAHVIAFYLAVGVWPSDRFIMHSCDTRRCCNPKHLLDGTCLDNNQDCLQKQRRGVTGGINHRSSLTEDDIREIRRLGLFFGGREISKLPRFIGRIAERGINSIINKERWKEIT